MKQLVKLLLILILASSNLIAQQNVELTVHLRDGNVIAGTSSLTNLSFQTEFGKLEIPLNKINAVQFGIGTGASEESKVQKLITQLSNSNEELRKSAYNELITLPAAAVIAIDNFLSSEKYIPSTYSDFTVESALSELRMIHGLIEPLSPEDVVFLDNGNSISGIYDIKKIDLKTKYGSLTIQKSDITSIDVIFTGSGIDNDRSFKLMGSKNISSNAIGGWLKTGIAVKPGQTIMISATGEVTLASLSGARYKPDGTISGASTEYVDYGNPGGTSTYPTYGNVVYKIGENGPMLRAGSQFKGTADASGILYLSIYETVFNPANSGTYTVKVSVK